MKLFANFIALLLMLSPTILLAEDFNIEEEELASLPKSVDAAVRADKSFEDYKECKLIGKAIDLTGQADSGFAVTTEDGCEWGASLGPIWVVYDTKPSPSVVLADGGNSLTLGKNAQNGLRNIATSAGTAGWYTEKLWKYDGKSYIKVKEQTATPK